MTATDIFKAAVRTSESYQEIAEKLYPGQVTTITRWQCSVIKEGAANLGVDTSHLKGQRVSGIKYSGAKVPLEAQLVEDSKFSTTGLKRRLLKAGLLTNKCSICGLLPEWNGKPLVLHLDHANGAHRDNRIENLRMLCPNCHTQTDTYCGKRVKLLPGPTACECCGTAIVAGATPSRFYCSEYCQSAASKARLAIEPKICPGCKQEFIPLYQVNKHCSQACARMVRRKVVRPTRNALIELHEKGVPNTAIGRMFGVCDNTVKKWKKAYKITWEKGVKAPIES